MFSNFGPTEILLILLVFLLLFGAKKIPELARGIGKSLTEFRKGLKDEDNDIVTNDKKKIKE